MEMGSAKRRVAAYDFDGTFYRWSLFLDLVDVMIREGWLADDVHREARSAELAWRSRQGSYAEYLQVLFQAYCKHIRGVPVSRMEEAGSRVLRDKGRHVYVFTRELLGAVQDCDYATIAISGSFQQVALQFGEAWGFTRVLGTIPEIDEDELLTGVDENSIVPMRDKAAALQRVVEELALTLDESIAVGDTHSDAGMLKAVRHPIAFNPDDTLAQHAIVHGQPVVVERKNMIYVMQCDLTVTLHDILPYDVADRLRERLRTAGVHVHGTVL
jgi:HAD superfamily phosphoserine phosphatase-like hydrolase